MKLAILIWMMTAACLLQGADENAFTSHHSYKEAYFLSPEAIKELEERANGSDEGAAFKLFQYHAIYRGDGRMGIKWLIDAATLGHVIAAYNLGIAYSSPKYLNHRRARFWFEAAARAGNEDAKKRLIELETADRRESSGCSK